MQSAYRLNVETETRGSDINTITLGLLAFNREHTDGAAPQYVVITVRDDAEQIAGGLVGLLYLGWLHIHALWLKEELRGQGYGHSLLTRVEEEAVQRGCANACLETYSFQALSFYEKHGYVAFAELAGLPPGGKKHFLRKSLKPS
jgi:GNAT superfamily N-acetyltransferase